MNDEASVQEAKERDSISKAIPLCISACVFLFLGGIELVTGVVMNLGIENEFVLKFIALCLFYLPMPLDTIRRKVIDRSSYKETFDTLATLTTLVITLVFVLLMFGFFTDAFARIALELYTLEGSPFYALLAMLSESGFTAWSALLTSSALTGSYVYYGLKAARELSEAAAVVKPLDPKRREDVVLGFSMDDANERVSKPAVELSK